MLTGGSRRAPTRPGPEWGYPAPPPASAQGKTKHRSVVCSYQVSSQSQHACIGKGEVKQTLKTVTRTLCTPRSAIYHKICTVKIDTIMIQGRMWGADLEGIVLVGGGCDCQAPIRLHHQPRPARACMHHAQAYMACTSTQVLVLPHIQMTTSLADGEGKSACHTQHDCIADRAQ